MKQSDYDLFISYARADRWWVDGYLLPVLALPEERVITPDRFESGRSILKEFERAIQCSRYTLIVFSPDYLADQWAVFGEELAGFANVTGQAERVIPLVLRSCDLPLHAAVRVQLDCIAQENWPGEVNRLCTLLQRPVSQTEVIPCPYPGMRSFTSGDAQHFFGRENEVDALLDRLRYQSFLMIIGPSGSGKSSLVYAGLLPALNERQAGRWAIHSLRPGSSPAAALSEGAQDLMKSTQAAPPDGRRLLLVIDPLEEVFSHPSRQERDAAIEYIQRLRHSGTCTLVLIMRADFYGDLMKSALWEVDPGQRFEVAPLRPDALRRAIQKPAAQVGVTLESGLAEQLVHDAAGEPGALPLMQETLALLWERREQRLLSFKAYQKLSKGETNGLTRAIAIMADAAYAGLSPVEQVLARRIFLRLVQFGEGRSDTRRQQTISELLPPEEDQQAGRQVLKHLVESRLLTLRGEVGNGKTVGSEESSSQAKVDLAHETLITAWPHFKEWIAEYKKAELSRRRLQSRAVDWLQTGKRGGLLDAVELNDVNSWLASPEAKVVGVDPDVLTFITASRQAVRANRRKSWLTPLAAVVSLALLVIAGWQGVQFWYRFRAEQLSPLVEIQGDLATIGDETGDLDQASPTIDVPLPTFWLEQHEVTNAQFCLCWKAGDCKVTKDVGERVCKGENPLKPVTNVTLAQASGYCAWLGRRLPTEIEWEWAARGPKRRLYATSNDPPIPGEVNISSGEPDATEEVWPIDHSTKDRTPDKDRVLWEMVGNVREWTVSPRLAYRDPLYATLYWPTPAPVLDLYYITRGGSYGTWIETSQAASRLSQMDKEPAGDVGFRCLRGLSIERFYKEVMSQIR
jgi:formylglycine-generating enzyme required for sulfatase activity